MRRPPPFGPLLAFAAVARTLSFTRAGEELGLTQSAVSHRVRELEAHLGARLVDRLNPGLRLTPAGEALLPDLERALDLLRRLPERLGEAGPPPLRLGLDGTVAARWLASRLPALAASHPDLAVEVVAFDGPEAAARAGVDVRLVRVPADEARETPLQVPLARETVFPVAAPGLLPADLAALPLIDKRTDGAGPEWDWETWLGPGARPGRGLRFREIGAALAAAEAGMGAALARSLLVADALAEGRLARVLPPARDLPCGKTVVVRWPAALSGDPRVAALRAWLLSAAGPAPAAAV
jgi:LysR family glycine cleavage system transcriptional activator